MVGRERCSNLPSSIIPRRSKSVHTHIFHIIFGAVYRCVPCSRASASTQPALPCQGLGTGLTISLSLSRHYTNDTFYLILKTKTKKTHTYLPPNTPHHSSHFAVHPWPGPHESSPLPNVNKAINMCNPVELRAAASRVCSYHTYIIHLTCLLCNPTS
jgi:hypothetical protein